MSGMTTSAAPVGVDHEMLLKLESMGFPTARAAKALIRSGNTGVEAAVNWALEHEEDDQHDAGDLAQSPSSVLMEIQVQDGRPKITEEMKKVVEELRAIAFKKRQQGEQKDQEGERKEGGVSEGELVGAERTGGENERKRKQMLDARKAEREEERRARQRILLQLEQDKAERRRWLELPSDHDPVAPRTSTANPAKQTKTLAPRTYSAKKDLMRECLRHMKKTHKGEDARVRRAFQTLLAYVGNVAKNPGEGRFRKIRVANPVFQERVGSVHAAVEFLELCGFRRGDGGKFLILAGEDEDMDVLRVAGAQLQAALSNPFFGILSPPSVFTPPFTNL